MDFDIQLVVPIVYSLTWGGGYSCVTFMADVGKWRLTVSTKDFI